VRDRNLTGSILEATRTAVAGSESGHRCSQLDQRTVVVDFELAGRPAVLDIRVAVGVVTLSVHARGNKVARHLRNVLIGKALIVHDPEERHVLRRWDRGSAVAREVARVALEWVKALTTNLDIVPNEFRPDLELPADHVSVFWWDGQSNFGDALGPWIVENLTRKPVISGRRISRDVPTLATVGSIIGQLNRNRVDIWGSGLLRPLRDEALDRLRTLEDVRVHAVRGASTRANLQDELGWDVPEVYGDPALLMPLLYRPRPSAVSQGKVSLVAHVKHAEHFQERESPLIHRVDVANSLEQVVDEIASSTACISSSLHGVVIAQAYGVPWTWLRITDRGLRGGGYKFEDFFTVLERSSVSLLELESADLAHLQAASAGVPAALPPYVRSLEPLLDAFPLARVPLSS
jgi:hypothetical protein